MKKLNKTEIELISRDIYNELKEQALVNTSTKVKELLQNTDVKNLVTLTKKVNKLNEEISELKETINKKFNVSVYYNFDIKSLAEQVLTKHINLGQIERSLILGQIDSKDLDSLIENVKNKFQAG